MGALAEVARLSPRGFFRAPPRATSQHPVSIPPGELHSPWIRLFPSPILKSSRRSGGRCPCCRSRVPECARSLKVRDIDHSSDLAWANSQKTPCEVDPCDLCLGLPPSQRDRAVRAPVSA